MFILLVQIKMLQYYYKNITLLLFVEKKGNICYYIFNSRKGGNNMNNLYKIFIVSLILIFLSPFMQVYSFDFNYEPSETNDTVVFNMAGKIAGAISVVGSVVSLCTLIYIGIKFMTGSVDERADYKKTLLPWLIGAVMVFAITLLPSLIFKIANSFN